MSTKPWSEIIHKSRDTGAFDVVGPQPEAAQTNWFADGAPGNPKDRIGDTKPQMHLVPPTAIVYAAKVMELGAAKYGPYNWRDHPVRATVYLSAALRHIAQALDGDTADPESGLPHEAHALACMAILLDALATGNLIDDRPTAGAAGSLITYYTEHVA